MCVTAKMHLASVFISSVRRRKKIADGGSAGAALYATEEEGDAEAEEGSASPRCFLCVSSALICTSSSIALSHAH